MTQKYRSAEEIINSNKGQSGSAESFPWVIKCMHDFHDQFKATKSKDQMNSQDEPSPYSPEGRAYQLIVGRRELTKDKALQMFKAGVAVGKSGRVTLHFKSIRDVHARLNPEQMLIKHDVDIDSWPDTKLLIIMAMEDYAVQFMTMPDEFGETSDERAMDQQRLINRLIKENVFLKSQITQPIVSDKGRTA